VNAIVKLSLGLTFAITLAMGQAAAAEVKRDLNQPLNAEKLPPHVVYRHFLAWVNEVDAAAENSNNNGSEKVAETFSRAHLSRQHFDDLRGAAHRLDIQLKQHEVRAQLLIKRYRKEAQEALAKGQPLPPAPQQIHDMERERTALLIDSYVRLRAALGRQG
jgi:hypothetical protein